MTPNLSFDQDVKRIDGPSKEWCEKQKSRSRVQRAITAERVDYNSIHLHYTLVRAETKNQVPPGTLSKTTTNRLATNTTAPIQRRDDLQTVIENS